MKKFLLSSIIMLGVCGAVNAQSATGSKFKKNEAATTTTSTAPAATPQKAAIAPAASDVVAPAESRTIADKEAAAKGAATTIKTGKGTQTAAPQPATVDAAGVVVSDEAKLQAVKAAEAKATGANEKKNQQ